MPSRKVRLGIVGVGNCASSLVQGLTYYRDAAGNEPVPGLMNVDLGGYHVGDVEVASAFDIAASKVGRDVGEAILAEPNNTIAFAKVDPVGVPVQRGNTLDGLGKYLRDRIPESDAPVADVTRALVDSGTDVVVSYLPVGSQKAARVVCGAARSKQAAPSSTACRCSSPPGPEWRERFERRGLPIIGDDIKSQVGATIVHRMLANLFRERGVRLDRTYQLNFGGNTDFENMLERERLESKKISKTQAVTSQLDVPLAPGNIHVGPSDHVPWLTDRKFAYIRLEGTTFGGRAAERRAQARGVGQPELRRHRHRRRALRQARARPGHRRGARRRRRATS